MPEEIKEKESHLEELIKEKEEAINAQEYEKAAYLRDQEQKLCREIENERKEWTSKRTLQEAQ